MALGAAMVIALALLAACGGAPAPPDGLEEGELFPSIVLAGVDGRQTPIAAYRGRLVLLNVWATWCEPCRRELPSLQRLSERVDAEAIAVVLLSVDDDDHVVREYLVDKQVRLDSYIDKDMQIAAGTLGITVFPDTFLIAPDGRLIRRFVGEWSWDTEAMVQALAAAAQGREFALPQR